MLRIAKLTMGKEAIVSCQINKLHPSELIRKHFPNPEKGQRLENCRVRRREIKKINRKDQMAIVIIHNSFMDKSSHQELYAVERWFRITQQGPSDYFFHVAELPEDNTYTEEGQKQVLPAAIIEGHNINIQNLHGDFDFDDDNDPAPENVPTNTQPSHIFKDTWGHNGTCNCRLLRSPNVKP